MEHSITSLAKKARVTVRTLRHYDQIGLLEPSLRLGNGKLFTIIANHVSDQNKYIQSAQLNGKPLDRAWFPHTAIANGGSLILEMGDKPNLKWGSAQEDAPPTTSGESVGLSTAE